MIRVLRVLTRLAAGGPPVHALTLNRALAARGYEVLLAIGECEPGERPLNHLLRPDDPVVWIPGLARSVHPRRDAQALLQLIRVIREFRPAIVHTHTAKAGLLGRLAARLVGDAVVVHTFHGHVLHGYFPAWQSRLVQTAERALARLTDALVTLSPTLAHELVAHYRLAPPERCHAIGLGMDLERMERLPLPEYPGGAPVIAWLGRMVAVKNLELLAATALAIRERLPGARFLFAGDGPERPVLMRWAERHPALVEVLPWMEDPATIIGRAHLLLLTSRNEGTPVALVEGLAAGRPFVATAVGGVPDLAGQGRYGLVGPADPVALAERVVTLIGSPGTWAVRCAEARSFAGESFTVDAMVTRIESLYQSLLSPANRWRHVANAALR